MGRDVHELKHSTPSRTFSKWMWFMSAEEMVTTADQLYLAQNTAAIDRMAGRKKVKDSDYVIKWKKDKNKLKRKKRKATARDTQEIKNFFFGLAGCDQDGVLKTGG